MQNTRRGILGLLLGGAAAAVIPGDVSSSRAGDYTPDFVSLVPPLEQDKSRIVLCTLDLSPPANLVNAKHMFLRFEFGPLRQRFDMHGLAMDRETHEVKPMGYPDKDDIKVVQREFHHDAQSSSGFQEEDQFRGRITAVEVIAESGDINEMLMKYLHVLQAGRAINLENIPYHALVVGGAPTPNSNAVANTLSCAADAQIPRELGGFVPGRDHNLLEGVEWERRADNYARTRGGYEQLACDITSAMASLSWSARFPDEREPAPFRVRDLGHTILTRGLSGVGYLVENGHPLHEPLVSYMYARSSFDEILGGHHPYPLSYEFIRDAETGIRRLRQAVRDEYGIDLPWPEQWRAEEAANADPALKL